MRKNAINIILLALIVAGLCIAFSAPAQQPEPPRSSTSPKRVSGIEGMRKDTLVINQKIGYIRAGQSLFKISQDHALVNGKLFWTPSIMRVSPQAETVDEMGIDNNKVFTPLINHSEIKN